MISLAKNLLLLLNKRQSRKLLFLQIFVVLAACLETISVISIAPFMSAVVDPTVVRNFFLVQDAADYFQITDPYGIITLMGVGIILLLALSSILSMYTLWQLSIFGARFGMELGDRLFYLYMSSDWLFHTQNNTSDLVKKISDDCVRVSDTIITPFLLLNARISVCILIISAMVAYDPMVALAGMSILIFAYLIIYFSLKRILTKNAAQVTNMSARRFRILLEGFSSVKDVILRSNFNYFQENLSTTGKHLAKARGGNLALVITPRYAMELVIFGSLVFLVIFILNSGSGNLMSSLPTLTFFAFSIFRLLPNLQQVYASSAQIKGNEHAYRSIEADLNNASKNFFNKEEKNNLYEVDKIELKSKLSLSNVCFKYPDNDNLALKNISLDINFGELVGVVGVSGSGKSTLGDLLLGFVNPTSGQILVDGREINKKNVKHWRDDVGYVPQNVKLLDTSFLENIAFGVKSNEIKHDMVNKALDDSDMKGVVAKEAEGIKSEIGEEGIRLSGGQRQRLALARALYRDFHFIVFDEATSALDIETQERIMQTIYKLRERAAIVLITHNENTYKYCDKLCVMSDGRIVDYGDREDVLTRINKHF